MAIVLLHIMSRDFVFVHVCIVFKVVCVRVC